MMSRPLLALGLMCSAMAFLSGAEPLPTSEIISRHEATVKPMSKVPHTILSSQKSSGETKAPYGMYRWIQYPPPSITVSLSGNGDFKSVQDAINSAVHSGGQQVVILLMPGTYNEKVIVPPSHVSIMLTGTVASKTIIQYGDTAGTKRTFWSCTFCVEADNFVAANITFKNTASWPGQQDVSTTNTRMAVAVRVSGTGSAFYNCQFLGWQDTLYDHKGLHYFRNCYIEGIVDFIFGDGTSIYEGCTINVKAANLGGSISAQKSASTSENSGFIFLRSTIDGTGKVYLGRAWGPASRVVYAYSYIGDIVAPGAWNDWGVASRQQTVFYAQVGCWGAGASMSNWASWATLLNPSQAGTFVSYNFIDAQDWLGPPPAGTVPTSELPAVMAHGGIPGPPSYPYEVREVPINVKVAAEADTAINHGTASQEVCAATWERMAKLFPENMEYNATSA